MRLSELTTMRIGGDIARYVRVENEQALLAAIREADERGDTVLVVGGGSNIIASDAPFTGTVIHTVGPEHPIAIEALAHDPSTSPAVTAAKPSAVTPLAPACGGATVEYFAGTPWDTAVAYAVERGMIGIEALSGIPGTVGATPIQNVGAYGQDVSHTISRVRTWDRIERKIRTFFAADIDFAYRDSLFKRSRMPGGEQPTGRYVILSVSFQHRVGDLSAPIAYAELAATLGVRPGERAPMREVRDAVLEIRAAKGMVLDASDHDTWSAGSFFTNPILTSAHAESLPPEAPRFPTAQHVKTSAAWLISHSGIPRGFTLNPERAGAAVSSKHSLALTNRGEASSDDIRELATHIRQRVHETFGVWLEPEPVRVGLTIGP